MSDEPTIVKIADDTTRPTTNPRARRPRRLRQGRGHRTAVTSSLRRHLVPGAPHGLDGTGVAELAPELPDVHVDRAAVAEEREAPDPLQELLARQDQATVLDERGQEVELLGRERDELLVDVRLACADLHAQALELVGGGLGRLRTAGARLGPPQHRAHPRHELTRV